MWVIPRYTRTRLKIWIPPRVHRSRRASPPSACSARRGRRVWGRMCGRGRRSRMSSRKRRSILPLLLLLLPLLLQRMRLLLKTSPPLLPLPLPKTRRTPPPPRPHPKTHPLPPKTQNPLLKRKPTTQTSSPSTRAPRCSFPPATSPRGRPRGERR
ncbi:hypothetical protein C8R45DRAFT_949933 [Mycena sanguinolenta]|nr:hypothetical protein C8R45DRAFT_949933 [Mycena sanguinolenta]